jgi:zinc finger protein CreA/MIG
MSYAHQHQMNLHQQLARLQAQHHKNLHRHNPSAVAPSMQSMGQRHSLSGPTLHPHVSASLNGMSHLHPGLQQQRHANSTHSHRNLAQSTEVSAAPSPASSDDSDDDPMTGTAFEFTPATSPVLTGMRGMSLLHGKATTAATSTATSPIHSRNPSRASSPDHGHSANSGKHGQGSHAARDAKARTHPYGHGHAHAHHGHLSASGTSTPTLSYGPGGKTRMSPPKHHRDLPGNNAVKQSVEEILNASMIPPPPDRTLPPPNSSTAYSTTPGMNYSLSQPNSAHVSPVGSRATSPVHPHQYGSNPNQPNSNHVSNLAHSVRAAFGMTPIHKPAGGVGVAVGHGHGQGHAQAQGQTYTQNPNGPGLGSHGDGHNSGGSNTTSTTTTNPSPKSYTAQHSPPTKLAPLTLGGGGKMVLPSFSRGSSPVHLMEGM